METNVKKLFNLLAAGAVCLTATSAFSASEKLPNLNVITVQFKLEVQGSFTDNGSVRTYNKPEKQKLATKDLLSILAADKYAQTNYPANFFPSGAKLAITEEGFVVVVNGNNELLVDVSDIIHFASSTNGIISGKVDNSTGLASSSTKEQAMAVMSFDDTFIDGGENLSFIVQGIDQISTNDSQPGQGGNYNEYTKDEIKNAAGEGQTGGDRFTITGKINGNRSAKLTLPSTSTTESSGTSFGTGVISIMLTPH